MSHKTNHEYLTGLSLTDLLLQAADLLPDDFSAEELTLQAYALAPARFALAGFAQHPDHHRVLAALCGYKGLAGRGYLERVMKCRYRLTEAGRERAAHVRGDQRSAKDPAWLQRTLNRMARFRPNQEEIELWAQPGLRGRAAFKLLQRAKLCGRSLSGQEAIQAFQEATEGKEAGKQSL